ncbi:MAG: hypothetical protein AAFW73_15965 [Bacteroidota bacterium]
MKKILLGSLGFLLLTVFFACQSEEDLLSHTMTETDAPQYRRGALVSGQLSDGRIYFADREAFRAFHQELLEQEEEMVAKILEDRYYSEGFYSLVPIVHEGNERTEVPRHIARAKALSLELGYTQGIKDQTVLDNYEKLEGLYSGEIFMSLVNEKAEIQIGEEIYKYTDTGLFIARKPEINDLQKYLVSQNISVNPLFATEASWSQEYAETNNPCGGMTPVGNYQHYVPTLLSDCEITNQGNSGGNYGGGPSSQHTPGGSGVTPEAELGIIAQELEQCSGSEPWFPNLFGTVKVCIHNYESRQRVKIKYTDVDLLLVYYTEIKVKHQNKPYIWWSKQSTNEVALGINSISWNFSTPSSGLPITNQVGARFYLYNGRMFESLTSYSNAVYAGDIPMPNLPFADDIDVLVELAINFPLSPLDSEADVREFFYEQLFEAAKNVLQNNSSRQLKRAGVVIKNLDQTWVQYYDLANRCTNCPKRDNMIDFGIVTPQINYTFGTGNGGNLTFDNFNFDFNTPNVVGINAYGMAKRNGQWYGRQMVF